MDETYIRMCDCPEIQERWEPKLGDKVFYRSEFNCDVISFVVEVRSLWITPFDGGYHNWADDMPGYSKEDVIWLPRQEDIQEMLPKEYLTIHLCLSILVVGFQIMIFI